MRSPKTATKFNNQNSHITSKQGQPSTSKCFPLTCCNKGNQFCDCSWSGNAGKCNIQIYNFKESRAKLISPAPNSDSNTAGPFFITSSSPSALLFLFCFSAFTLSCLILLFLGSTRQTAGVAAGEIERSKFAAKDNTEAVLLLQVRLLLRT